MPGTASELSQLSRTDALIGLVNDRKKYTVGYHQHYFNKLATWYDQFRGIYAGRVPAFRNAVAVPFLFSVVMTDVSRKTQAILGGWPIVTFAGYSPEDEPNAKRNETLISAQMKDCASFQKGVDFFTTADLYGTAVARYGWKRKRMKKKWRVSMDQMMGGQEVVMEDPNAIEFDGPDWTVIDPLDFWPEPNRRSIDDMDWVIQRYFMNLDDLREQAQDEQFRSGAIRELEQAPLQGSQADEAQRRLSVYRTWDDYQSNANQPHKKLVEIWEMWGAVPMELAHDGYRFRRVTIANGRVLLADEPYPYWEGRKPFHSYAPMPDPHYFHGVGKIEIGEKLQQTVNRMTNQKLDALDMFIDPMWVASATTNINTQNLFTKPGKIFLVDGPADDTAIRPLIPNLNGLQAAMMEIGQLWGYIQQATGITEASQGMGPSSRETARAFMGRQENVMTRLMLESRLAEECFVEPLANSFRALNRQYLSLPHEVKILASRALINPISGLPMPQEPTIIEHPDLIPEYRARAVGATQSMGKSVRQQNIVTLLQAMGANPALMQLVNWSNFARQMFTLFDFENVNELLVSMVPQISSMAEQMSQDPGAVAGAAQQGLDQLSPEVLGSMFPQGGAATMAAPGT